MILKNFKLKLRALLSYYIMRKFLWTVETLIYKYYGSLNIDFCLYKDESAIEPKKVDDENTPHSKRFVIEHWSSRAEDSGKRGQTDAANSLIGHPAAQGPACLEPHRTEINELPRPAFLLWDSRGRGQCCAHTVICCEFSKGSERFHRAIQPPPSELSKPREKEVWIEPTSFKGNHDIQKEDVSATGGTCT